MNQATDEDLLRDFCRRGFVLAPRDAVRRGLELALDDATHDDLLIGWIESDARLEFCFLVGANLPAFGDVQLIHSVRQAVGRLGRRRISSLLWLASISDFCLSWTPVDSQTRREILRHALLTGFIARHIQAATRDEFPYDSLIAGVAHNLGDLLLAAAPPKLALVGRDETDPPVVDEPSPHAEADACRLGALLLEIWNAPGEVVSCTRHFRNPRGIEEQFRSLRALVRFAERLALVLESEPPLAPLTLEALPEWRELTACAPWNEIADLGSRTRAQLPESLLAADHLVTALGG